ncbi:Protein kinase domain containing protein [Entamoeba marina]
MSSLISHNVDKQNHFFNFNSLYSRTSLNDIPACEVFECSSKRLDDDGRMKYYGHVIKKYFDAQNHLDYINEEIKELVTFLHENVLLFQDCFIHDNEAWIVFEGTNTNGSRYGSLKIDKLQKESANSYIFDIVSAVNYLVKSKNLSNLRISPLQFVGFNSPTSPFPTLKYLYEKQATNGEWELNYYYTAPECFDGKRSDWSYLWSIGVILSRLWCQSGDFIDKEDYQQFIISCKNYPFSIATKDYVEGIKKWFISKYLEPDPEVRKNNVGNTFYKQLISFVSKDKFIEGSADNYQYLGKLGNGSNGEVFLALNKTTNQCVAIKKGNNHIKREQYILEMCYHDNVVKLIDYFKDKNNTFMDDNCECLVLEYCDYGSLQQLLDKRELTTEEYNSFTLDLLSGLYYLHDVKNLVHRDLKPANLLLHKGTRVIPQLKISDYGLTREHVDLMSSFVGTILYASPQILLNSPYSVKTDFFSVGIILYYMYSHKLPFGEQKYEICDNVSDGYDVIFPVDMPTDLVSFISGLLIIDEKKRFSWSKIHSHDYYKRINGCRKSSTIYPTTISSKNYE